MKLTLVLALMVAALRIIAQPSELDSLTVEAEPSLLVFCGGVENELPVGVSDRFIMDTAWNGYIYVFFSQASVFGMKELFLEITDASGEKIRATEKFSVKPKWKYTFLKCRFTAQGDYRVALHDTRGKTLATGSVSITVQ